MKYASLCTVFAFTSFGLVSLVACTTNTTSPAPSSSSSSGGSSSGGSSSGGTTSERTGVTECAGQNCQAGQYCINLHCETGCGSDNNCAANQTCVKESGEDVGSCQNTSTPTPTKDCDGWQEKCVACGETAANCTAACKVITSECIECVKSESGCNQDACKSLCNAE